MENNRKHLISIWGKRWEPIRKWFYPIWLFYETTERFYEYALSVYHLFEHQQDDIGEVTAQVLSIIASVCTFLICFAFLTIPACIALFKFFTSEKTYNAPFERQLKRYF